MQIHFHTEQYSNRAVWHHYVGIVVPSNLDITNMATLFYPVSRPIEDG